MFILFEILYVNSGLKRKILILFNAVFWSFSSKLALFEKTNCELNCIELILSFKKSRLIFKLGVK